MPKEPVIITQAIIDAGRVAGTIAARDAQAERDFHEQVRQEKKKGALGFLKGVAAGIGHSIEEAARSVGDGVRQHTTAAVFATEDQVMAYVVKGIHKYNEGEGKDHPFPLEEGNKYLEKVAQAFRAKFTRGINESQLDDICERVGDMTSVFWKKVSLKDKPFAALKGEWKISKEDAELLADYAVVSKTRLQAAEAVISEAVFQHNGDPATVDEVNEINQRLEKKVRAVMVPALAGLGERLLREKKVSFAAGIKDKVFKGSKKHPGVHAKEDIRTGKSEPTIAIKDMRPNIQLAMDGFKTKGKAITR